MSQSDSALQKEIESWLKIALSKEKISKIAKVEIIGKSGKGDGYLGDIIYTDITAKLSNGKTKIFQLVLKCSKRNEILRESSPVKEAFCNEIYIYDTILPEFQKFQKKYNTSNIFSSVPKFYGSFTSSNMEVIVLENLKKLEFGLWDKKQPLSRHHLEMMIPEYGRLHAISVAMAHKEPTLFQKLVQGLYPSWKNFSETSNMELVFKKNIEKSCQMLEKELNEKQLRKWRKFGNEVKEIFQEMLWREGPLKVIAHGDCWSNNFMFKHNDQKAPLKFAILDWQMASYRTPVADVAYLLFSCISAEDIDNLDYFLSLYYQTFAIFLSQMECDANVLYTQRKFCEDWKKYARFGIMMISLVFFLCSTDDDEVIDAADTTEENKEFGAIYGYDLQDFSVFKERISYVVKYAADHDLI